MIDLETLGTSSDCVFLSVAALQFELDGRTGKEFKMNVELESAMKAGRTISSGTLKWWLTQKPEIMKLMFVEPAPLILVLKELKEFMSDNKLLYPWGNSASFDLGILNHAYQAAGIMQPWRYSNERCYRTIWNLLAKFDHNEKSERAHDPLADCYYQVEELSRLALV